MSWAFFQPIMWGSLVAAGVMLLVGAYWLAGKRRCPDCGHESNNHTRFDGRLWCRDCSIQTGDGYGRHE